MSEYISNQTQEYYRKRCRKLERAINAALRIKDLWVPGDEEVFENETEAQALNSMYYKFIEALGEE